MKDNKKDHLYKLLQMYKDQYSDGELEFFNKFCIHIGLCKIIEETGGIEKYLSELDSIAFDETFKELQDILFMYHKILKGEITI